MIWDWGFTWKNIDIEDCDAGINVAVAGGKDKQGTGVSVSALIPIFPIMASH
jgi:hypothetical protein